MIGVTDEKKLHTIFGILKNERVHNSELTPTGTKKYNECKMRLEIEF